ncbi:alternative ribosome rescue aminoacyl-tRNA hydrolase ArfB [Vibrio viridaestus]|uniref:Peptidyl-tRNA hydrolase ArfB n=1 Tax=Vibrio viridaestus TaxID=2487322 RepID=A0A3N9TKH0_9VIBR|nr:alternative ribosome rescue aminoacyl-tRNA hydrolase ArfB [Vibrio viridaestus]RQW64484.1 aminoacyl-tRNA hydrolase [Vibrio viridaestus]
MIKISNNVSLPDSELDFKAIRAQGAGGQNVNKVSSAIHLRFDIVNSSLPDFYKEKLLRLKDSRLTTEGEIVIKAQQHRTQEKNRIDAIERLVDIITSVAKVEKVRKATKPTRSSKMKRLDKKKQRSSIKATRGKIL